MITLELIGTALEIAGPVAGFASAGWAYAIHVKRQELEDRLARSETAREKDREELEAAQERIRQELETANATLLQNLKDSDRRHGESIKIAFEHLRTLELRAEHIAGVEAINAGFETIRREVRADLDRMRADFGMMLSALPCKSCDNRRGT